MWADVAELADAVCMDTPGWYEVPGDPTDWAVAGTRDVAAEGGNIIEDGDGSVICGRPDSPGDPVLG